MDGQQPQWAVAQAQQRPPQPTMQQQQQQIAQQQLAQQQIAQGPPQQPQPPPSASTPQPPSSKRPSIEQSPLVTRTPDEEAEDGRIRNREAVTKIRDLWIYKQIRARQDEFTQYKQVSAVFEYCFVTDCGYRLYHQVKLSCEFLKIVIGLCRFE